MMLFDIIVYKVVLKLFILDALTLWTMCECGRIMLHVKINVYEYFFIFVHIIILLVQIYFRIKLKSMDLHRDNYRMVDRECFYLFEQQLLLHVQNKYLLCYQNNLIQIFLNMLFWSMSVTTWTYGFSISYMCKHSNDFTYMVLSEQPEKDAYLVHF